MDAAESVTNNTVPISSPAYLYLQISSELNCKYII